MRFHFPYMLTLFSLVFAVSYGTQNSAELYWKSVLPNTPMPKAVVTDLLQSGTRSRVSTRKFGKEGVSVNGNIGYGFITYASDQLHENKISKGELSVNTKIIYASSEADNGDWAIYFMEKDIHLGTKMNLNFIKSSNEATFIPREEAESIPFSSKKLPEILNKLSLKPHSPEAEMVKETIKECEDPNMEGEEKFCATSLESMIDFATSKVGKHAEAVSTEVAGGEGGIIQKYRITEVGKKKGINPVVCHKQSYPFAVFYCHRIQATEAYVVRLEGDDGTKAKAVAVCHKDTSRWNPNHLAFQMLKAKPGTVAVCHFLLQETIAWI